MDFWWISKNVDILSKNGLYWRQKNVIFSNIFQMIYMKLAQSMSNWCIIRYSKFRVDICNGFGVTAKIRGGQILPPPPPPTGRGLIFISSGCYTLSFYLFQEPSCPEIAEDTEPVGTHAADPGLSESERSRASVGIGSHPAPWNEIGRGNVHNWFSRLHFFSPSKPYCVSTPSYQLHCAEYSTSLYRTNTSPIHIYRRWCLLLSISIRYDVFNFSNAGVIDNQFCIARF